MQISNVKVGQQFQAAQRLQSQTPKVEGSHSEEVNESTAERASEAQKNAVAQISGLGINFDKRI